MYVDISFLIGNVKIDVLFVIFFQYVQQRRIPVPNKNMRQN